MIRSYKRYSFKLSVGIIFLLLNVILLANDFNIRLVSISSSGVQGNNFSDQVSISADGHFVAFESRASNLVSNDLNGTWDAFVRDMWTGETTRVSISSSGGEANGISFDPSISANGRFVAFTSTASNLVVNDTNATYDVFVHDRQTGETTRVSLLSNGEQGTFGGLAPSISSDGRFVAFGSISLDASDTNGYGDLYVHDRQTGETTIVSVSSLGELANESSSEPTISSDGRMVAFASSATNLVQSDTNGKVDVFVHDRQTGETKRVSVSALGQQGNGDSFYPSISANGNFVVFYFNGTNLMPDYRWPEVYVSDLQTGEITRVNVSSSGDRGNYGASQASISADGRFVAFSSGATNLVPDDTNLKLDIFVHDQQTGATRRVSVSDSGTQGDKDSDFPEISADGRFIAFESIATNLIPNDSNPLIDVFWASDVNWEPPSLPNAAPVQGYFTELPVTLTWSQVKLANSYQVQVATSNNFSLASTVLDTTTAADTLYINIPELAKGVYYWRVRGQFKSMIGGTWSTVESFTLAAS